MENKRRFFLSILLIIFCKLSFPQSIVIDDTQNTSQLVNNLSQKLQSTCTSIDNISIQNFNDFNSNFYSIGTFSNTNSNFELSDGIVLTTDSINIIEGPNPGISLGNEFRWNNTSDSDLKYILDNIYSNNYEVIDNTILEFDITSNSSFISFDYIFASNHRSTASRSFSEDFNKNYDGFAILVSGPGITNDTGLDWKNIALIPNQTDYVGLHTICEDCPYSEYHINREPGSGNEGPIGLSFSHTPFTAEFETIPNETYKVKILIGSRNSPGTESALFLKLNKQDIALNVNNSFNICDGETINIDASDPSDDSSVEYKWYDISSGSQVDLGLSNSSEELPLGRYRVEKILNNCSVTDDFIVNSYSVTSNSDSNQLICGDNSSVTLSVTNSFPSSTTFNWSRVGSNEILSTSNSLQVTASGQYEVLVSFDGGLCEESFTYSVSSLEGSFDLQVQQPEDPCNFPKTIEVFNFSTNSDDFFLDINNNQVISPTPNSGDNFTFQVFSAGTYTIRLKSNTPSGVCVLVSEVITVTTTEFNVTQPQTFTRCDLSDYEIDGSVYNDGISISSYTWINSSNQIVSNNSVLEVNNLGNYRLDMVSVNGCNKTVLIEVEGQESINDNPNPAKILACNTDSQNLTIPFANNLDQVIWSDDNSSDNPRTVSSAGAYSVSVTDAEDGCVRTANYEVLFDESVAINLIDSIQICASNNFQLEAFPQESGNFNYSVILSGNRVDGGGNIPINNGDGISFNVNSNGEYIFNLLGPLTPGFSPVGCSSQESVISINNRFSLPSVVTVCEEQPTFDFDASLTDINATYFWNEVNQGSNPLFTATSPGSYSVNALLSSGCTMPDFNISVIEIEDYDIQDEVRYISGNGTVSLQAQNPNISGLRYNWLNSNGESIGSSRAINVLESGTYTVQISNNNGCVVTEVYNLIIIRAFFDRLLICDVEDGINLDSSQDHSEDGVTYNWSLIENGTSSSIPDDDTGIINVNVAGDYKVDVSYLGNTVSFNRFTEESQFKNVVMPDDFIFCSDSLNLIGDGPDFTANYRWFLDDELLTQYNDQKEIPVIESGTYRQEVIIENCSYSSEVTANEFIVPDLGNIQICSLEGSTNLIATSNFPDLSEYIWDTGETSDTIEVTEPGSYSVQVTGQAKTTTRSIFTENFILEDINCIKNKTANVEGYLPDINYTFLNDNTIQVSSNSIDFTPLLFGLNSRDFSSDSIFVLQNGITFASVKDSNDCINSIPVVIPEIPNFFSPNGDNINEHWLITDLDVIPDAEYTVYDSSGSLIVKYKQSEARNVNWNTFGMGSGVYSFKVSLPDRRVFSGRFILKRK